MLRIREIRKLRGIKAKEAAEFLNLKYRTYMSYEQGDRDPPMSKVFCMCFLFNCTADYLYGRSNDPDKYASPIRTPLSMQYE